MLSPIGTIDAARAPAASFARRLKIKYTATSEKSTSELPVRANNGRSGSQADMGMSCNAFQAVQRASIVPQFPFKARAALARKNAAALLIKPVRPTAIAPAMRHLCGIRSHTTAAQSANALHILIE